jgi:haloacetate dehalogenase
MMLWSSRDDMAELYGDPLEIWKDWTTDLRGHAIDSGHHVAEANPSDLVDALRGFLHSG